MNTHSTLRKVLAFFRRDVAIARSYRIAFALEILEAFFGVATFYYLSRFVSSEQLTLALPAGRDYFAFALVGFAIALECRLPAGSLVCPKESQLSRLPVAGHEGFEVVMVPGGLLLLQYLLNGSFLRDKRGEQSE